MVEMGVSKRQVLKLWRIGGSHRDRFLDYGELGVS